MNPKVAEDQLAREEIVAALTGPLDERGEHEASIAEMVERAACDLDRRVASECGRVLGDCVFQEHPRTRELEALVIVGIAHPRVFRKFGLSVSSEGRRLALMLENEGRSERARELLELLAQRLPEDREVQRDLASLMRRNGGVDQFIERCLQRAEREAKAGRFMESISCLQEVLLHDQGRRDVARMIRDLRYEEMGTRERRRRRARLVSLACLLVLLVAALAIRELSVRQGFRDIPSASGDAASIRRRIAALDSFRDEHVFWSGYFACEEERLALQRQADAITAREADQERERIRQLQQRVGMAETARVKGVEAVERNDMTEALQQFRSALELCTDDWKYKQRVASDVAALEKWLEGQRD